MTRHLAGLSPLNPPMYWSIGKGGPDCEEPGWAGAAARREGAGPNQHVTFRLL